MTLDEAIKHCEEVAMDKADLACTLWDSKEKARCEDCAKEHRQLAEWLKELKRQREAWEKVKAEIEKEHDNIIRDEYSMRQNDYCDGFQFAMKQAFKIIDKHLQEVTDA
jgi:hypothetical protein